MGLHLFVSVALSLGLLTTRRFSARSNTAIPGGIFKGNPRRYRVRVFMVRAAGVSKGEPWRDVGALLSAALNRFVWNRRKRRAAVSE
jgi:hypothetical protein